MVNQDDLFALVANVYLVYQVYLKFGEGCLSWTQYLQFVFENLASLKINGLPGLQGLRTYYLAVYVDIGHLVHQVYSFAFASNVYLVY